MVWMWRCTSKQRYARDSMPLSDKCCHSYLERYVWKIKLENNQNKKNNDNNELLLLFYLFYIISFFGGRECNNIKLIENEIWSTNWIFLFWLDFKNWLYLVVCNKDMLKSLKVSFTQAPNLFSSINSKLPWRWIELNKSL